MPDPPKTITRLRIMVAAVVGVGVLGALVSRHGSAPPVSDRQIIERIVVQAQAAPLTLPFKILGATAFKDAAAIRPNVVVATSAADIQATLAHARSVLNSLYAPNSPELPVWLDKLGHAITGMSGGTTQSAGGTTRSPGDATHMTAAGIRNVVFQSVVIHGVRAEAHLTYTAFSIGVDTMPNGQRAPFSPANKMIADVSLVRTSQGWRIMSANTRFAPGSEP